MTTVDPERSPDLEPPVAVIVSSPAPMNVAGTVLALLGAAYPQAQFCSPRPGEALRVEVPRDADPAPVKDPASHVVQVLRIDPDGLSFETPQQLASMLCEVVEQAFTDVPEAENYLEMPLTWESSRRRYVMTFARSADQTPHALRRAAEARADAAEARAADAEDELARLRSQTTTEN